MVARGIGLSALAVSDELLCFAVLAVLFFAGTVIICHTCHKAIQDSGD